MENVSEFAYFPHDREQLLNTIARFDGGLRVEDVVGIENESDNFKHYSNTVLIQVLLEFICHAFVKEENYREKLLMEACKRLSKFKILNDLLIMDKSNELRMTMKHKVISFLKQICEEVIPTAKLDSSAVHLFENDQLSTDIKLYYCNNFIELGKIAQGGFGTVFKAQYKLNKLIYAVKKIPFDYKTDANFLMVMREANNFAALNHLNIVRYYSAWIEMADSDSVNKFPVDVTCSITDFQKADIVRECSGLVIKEKSSGSSDSLSLNDLERNSYNSSKSGDSDSVIFSESADTTNDVNWIVGNYSQSSSDHSDDSRDESNYYNDSEDILLSNFKIQGILYIQMEYCDCDLRFWLDKRAETKGKELPFEMDVDEIFTNILKGVAHIHSRGIIHRDLKPHNIFYSQSCNTVKIGDFGLATLSGFSVDSSNYTSHGHSSSIGTVPYAAPEQMKSKNYDMKVDIYSLGVILIELINICSTRAELSYIIKTVKDGKIEGEIKKFPFLGNLARNLISDNPKDRMSAKEIINLFEKDSKVILKEVLMNEFATKIKKNEEAIQNLSEVVKNIEVNVKDVKEEVKNLQAMVMQLNSKISKLDTLLSEPSVKS